MGFSRLLVEESWFLRQHGQWGRSSFANKDALFSKEHYNHEDEPSQDLAPGLAEREDRRRERAGLDARSAAPHQPRSEARRARATTMGVLELRRLLDCGLLQYCS